MPSFQQATEKSIEDVPRAISEDMSPQRALELTASLPWEAKDVGSFRYSDSNYVALGQLLEKRRGKPYTQVIRDDGINPLGLASTSIDKAVGGELPPTIGLLVRVCFAHPTRCSYRQDMPRGRVENTPGARRLLAGQTSIDDVLKEQYDLTPQLPLHWVAFETTPPGRRSDTGPTAAGQKCGPPESLV